MIYSFESEGNRVVSWSIPLNLCLLINDFVSRYMQIRGCAKRHTVGCTDDLSVTHHPSEACCGGYDPQAAMPLNNVAAHQTGGISSASSTVPAAGGGAVSGNMRTRRTGLLTVTERPPGN